MLKIANIARQGLSAYADIAVGSVIDDIAAASAGLAGLRVVHVSATAYGGGVAEILKSLVPLMRDAGLDAEWRVLEPDQRLFRTTKTLHNALQGGEAMPSPGDLVHYMSFQEELAATLDAVSPDVLVLHDPQVLGAAAYLRRARTVVGRLHIDLSHPHPDATSVLGPAVRACSVIVCSMPEFMPKGVLPDRVRVILPAIDPFSAKNVPLDEQDAQRIVRDVGIDDGGPLMTQVSRFDRWKDPLGVIDAYRLVRTSVPECRLVLAGSMADDDPEAADMFERTVAHAGHDDGILIRTDGGEHPVRDREINALQTVSDVIVQKSLREGFGLTVTEAMWKARAVVAGNVGGIRSQVIDGRNGLLAVGVRDCASAVVRLLRDPSLRERLGASAAETVAERFLMPRLLLDHIRLYRALLRR